MAPLPPCPKAAKIATAVITCTVLLVIAIVSTVMAWEKPSNWAATNNSSTSATAPQTASSSSLLLPSTALSAEDVFISTSCGAVALRYEAASARVVLRANAGCAGTLLIGNAAGWVASPLASSSVAVPPVCRAAVETHGLHAVAA
eukprot:gnl/Trimastix_PCT/2665.p1 GENE.gnl/Trimastix_PCT/2665~~gnl/Trimastix_PCT/2665.p1  ORF type:complete len:162 (+),score=12.67 gnl/Trimastix_PCT/2665:53-487(+)